MAFDLRKNNDREDQKLKRAAHKAGAPVHVYAAAHEKQKSRGEGQEDWLLTYSDMVTLLLVFFVLLFSFSEIDQSRFEQIHQSLQGSLLQQETTRPFGEVEEQINDAILEYELEKVVETQETGLGIQLQLGSTYLYELGSAEIRQEMEHPLQVIARRISEIEGVDYMVEVEGHTDDVPIATDQYESNWELSAHRATNIVRFFNDQGIAQERLEAVAYGESRPIVPNRDEYGEPIEENQAKNRRIVIHVRRASPDEVNIDPEI